jgi:hypothetical protein
MSNSSIQCDLPVRPRQECLRCVECDRWRHETCDTGIAKATYREAAVQTESSIDWHCMLWTSATTSEDLIPATENTRIDKDGNLTIYEPHLTIYVIC